MRRNPLVITRLLILVAVVIPCIPVTGAAGPDLERRFTQNVRPFLTSYCIGCHSGATPAAQFDLKAYSTVAEVVRDYPHWNLVLEKLTAREMPPKPAKQPSADALKEVINWVQDVRTAEARRTAGDPGPVLARRLSNAEYNYTIRDLTGVDLRPTREFPVDPANTAGFDNSGESLSMSPALLNKYLQAAREVGDHMVLTPGGFDFSPHPMLVETDREKYAIQRILEFYKRSPTDYADYFQAAWRYKNRSVLGKQSPTLEAIASDAKVSPKYLRMIWQTLEESPQAAQAEVGPIAKLQAMWRGLPSPGANQPDVLRAKCVEMRDFVMRIRSHTAMQFSAPLIKGVPTASQPLLNWKLRAFSLHHRDSDPQALRNDTDPQPVEPVIPRYAGLHQEAAPRWAALSAKARMGDMDLVVPAAERSRYEASFSRLASVFPDTFYVTERGRFWPDDSQDKGRLLSAGYHSVVGYFRDDTALMELVLDEKGQKELDSLWDEFDFMADFTTRTWDQWYFNNSGAVLGKGAEAGRERPLDKPVNAPEVIFGIRDEWLAKAAADPNHSPDAPEAVRHHFQGMNDAIRRMERMHVEAEARHKEALLKFAARAYRRPLTPKEREDTLAFYHTLREKNALTHEEAIRDSIVSVLMSPKFCYRIDLGSAAAAPAASLAAVAAKPQAARRPIVSAKGTAVASTGSVAGRPLSAYALASRLSYFLWSSMPDDELLSHAAKGDLQKPDVLIGQARRMLKDSRARGLAIEFGGNWLDFRRFEEHNAVDRERFPSFNNDLRQAMFEEPIRFMEDVIQNDRSVLDMVYGNYTFVNPILAKHYGMPEVAGKSDTWVRVDDAGQYGRGSLLPMSVFLTLNAPGLRTSPVKRGNWIVKRVLGEQIPPPPAVVPELPHDEAKLDLPLRDMLAKHRENPACAACHARFDSFGLAFEGYGPIGEKRSHDLAGHAVDTKAAFPGGSEGSGFEGVQAYIREHRQNDFIDNLSRKLLAYSLGRSLMLSDDSTVESMRTRLAANGYRFNSLVETIVTSPQFINKRSTNSPGQKGE